MAYDSAGDSTSVGTHLQPIADIPFWKTDNITVMSSQASESALTNIDLICEFYISTKLKHIFSGEPRNHPVPGDKLDC